MPIRFACSSCGKKFALADNAAGKKAKCACGHSMQVPDGKETGSRSSDTSKVAKSKAAKSKGSSRYAPSRIVGAMTTDETDLSPAAKKAAEWNALLDEAVQQQRIALGSRGGGKAEFYDPGEGATEICPSCNSSVVEEAVLCVSCGYHFRKRKRLETKSDTGQGG